jgi:hypothetical protein
MEQVNELLKEAHTETRELSECERLVLVSDKSQEIGRFLDWLEEQGIVHAEYHRHLDTCYYGHPDDGDWPQCGYRKDQLAPRFESKEKLLARFYDIDLNKIERERCQMLADIRKQHASEQIEKELKE